MTVFEDSHSLKLNQLTVPKQVFHIQGGNTFCSNDQILLLQDDSTTVEFRLPPKFQSKRIPWRFGLVRDIVWCSKFDVFLLLTRNALHSLSPKSMFISSLATNKPLEKYPMKTYKRIQPFKQEILFWRCACADTTLYITYAGYGTVVEEYSLEISSGKQVRRWISPQTCATHEGIWCIRHHPETDQLAFTILDSRTNQWHFEVRSRDELTRLWSINIPITVGDVEISPLSHGDWLVIDSFGVRLIHLSNEKLKAIVEYLRELRNATTMTDHYFIIRTKNTLEIHEIK